MALVNLAFFPPPGEHFRNWRPRYFILKDNGQFLGFRNKPTLDTDLADPLNNFTVRNCEIIMSNRPKPFTFSIRGLQMTTVVVRTFYVDTEEERRSWIQAIEQVKKKLEEENMDTDEPAETNPYVDMFGRRGRRQHSSGRTKIVSKIKMLLSHFRGV